MEDFNKSINKSIKEVVEPLFFEVTISKGDDIISLRLDRYDFESINMFTFIRLGYKFTIKLSL